MTQIAQNNVEPEELQVALVAFYPTADRLPFIADDHRGHDELAEKGLPLFQFSFKMPFSTR